MERNEEETHNVSRANLLEEIENTPRRSENSMLGEES